MSNLNQIETLMRGLVRAVSGDEQAELQALPQAGTERTFVVKGLSERGIARVIGKKGATYKSLCTVLNTMAFPTGVVHRLVVEERDERA